MGADFKPVVPIENTHAMCWRTFGEPFKTDYGDPQGTVLGQLLFTLYTTPLRSVISGFNICHHLYADDTDLSLALHDRPWDVTMAGTAVLTIRFWLDDS